MGNAVPQLFDNVRSVGECLSVQPLPALNGSAKSARSSFAKRSEQVVVAENDANQDKGIN